MVITEGHLWGGRIRYSQPASGFRSGIEPLLLAASVPARPGDQILEAGTGAGATLLCLAMRVPAIHAVGVEVDGTAASLAVANAQANRLANIEIITGHVEATRFQNKFDHAVANPPYHRPDGSASPSAARETAKRGSDILIAAWIDRLSGALRDRGTLTFVVPAGLVPACLLAMTESRCPCTLVFPLWPKVGRPAKLVLLRGIKNARAVLQLMPGLVLHQSDGRFTPAARRILTDGGSLELDHGEGASNI